MPFKLYSLQPVQLISNFSPFAKYSLFLTFPNENGEVILVLFAITWLAVMIGWIFIFPPQLQSYYKQWVLSISKVLFGKIVIQKITLYDKYQSALDRVEPCRITVPLLAKREVKQNAQIYLDKFRNTYGMVRNGLLIYINKSTYDTHHFERLFAEGQRKE